MSFPGHYDVDDNIAGPSSRPVYAQDGRPWSPLNYDDDVAPRGRNDYFVQQNRGWNTSGRGRERRQEASEASIEALDLADYAQTLRRTDNLDAPYPPFPMTSHVHPLSVPTPRTPTSPRAPFAAYPEYPPSPPPARPFSVQSRDAFSPTPPSLVSGESSYETYESYSSSGRPYANRRPYSLPSFLAPVPDEYLPHRGPAIFSATSDSSHRSLVRMSSPNFEDPEGGDISKFPAFSHHWFDDPSATKSKSGKYTSLPAYSDLSPSPPSLLSRNVLPWSSQDTDSGRPVDEATKQERMRMLEHEFGKKGKYDDDDGEPVIGSVDEKGNLITVGPKKRAAVRWGQGLFGLAAVVSSVYGALFIKTPTPAPPAGRVPAFVLYGVSIISFLLTFYLFAIRPCCCGGRSKKGKGAPGPMLPGGLVALPIQSLPGGKKAKKKGKKDKKGYQQPGDVQVNLIVDPGLFNRNREGSDNEEDFDGSEWSSRSRKAKKGRGRPRRSVFEGLAIENEWRHARQFLKKLFVVDLLFAILWAGAFVFVLFGKRCPSGQFNGWCNTYNIATALAVFASLSFAFSVYFDIVDLHASKASPRTRT